jgi:hypothetical protein
MKLLSMLTTAGIGAALVYLYDPVSGNRRRAVVRERANKGIQDAQRFLEVSSRDLQNRSLGMLEEMRSRLAGQKVDDDKLVRRVASKLGHYMSRAKDVGITAEDGVVTLEGPILSTEVDAVMRMIARIPGVREVHNQMELHEASADMPQTLRKKWTPARRLAVGSAGLILAASTRSLMRGRRRA